MITEFPHEFQTWRGETVVVTNPADGHYHLEVEGYKVDWYQPPYSRTKVEREGGGDFSRYEWEALQAFWQLMK